MLTVRARLESLIQSKHLLSHEFYVRWQAGKLSKEEMQGYAKEYYAFEKEFPRFVSRLHGQCEDASMRQSLLENLQHEEAGEDNHPELWLRFAEGVGVSRSEVQNHFHSDETEHLLRTFRKYSEPGCLVEGIAALFAYERQQPDVARTKSQGLSAYYGVNDDRALEFFKVHQHYDVLHSESEGEMLNRLCTSEDVAVRAETATRETLSALYDFLDGVTRRYAPEGVACCM